MTEHDTEAITKAADAISTAWAEIPVDPARPDPHKWMMHVGAAFSSTATYLGELDVDLDKVRNELLEKDQRIADLEQRIGDLENSLSSHDDRIVECQNALEELDPDNLSTTVENLERRLGDVEELVE